MMVLDATDQSIPNTKLLYHKVKGVPIRIVPLAAQLLLSVTFCHYLSLLDLQVANRAATLRKNKSGGTNFRLDTLEELTMLYKARTIKNGEQFHNLGPDDFFVLDHQKVRDSEKRLTEVAPPSSPSH